MRSIRSKKIKNEASKYLTGPFDESLIQIQLDKNEKCIQQIGKDNFERAAEFLRQIKTDGEMISSYNRQKSIIKCLTLNTEAYLYQKQKKFDLALRCLEQAQMIQTNQQASPIDAARTKLNKSVILSYMGSHEESIKMAQIALELLKKKQNIEEYELRKNQYKLYEIMIVSFYNIASQLAHLSDSHQAHRVYKEGYYLATKMLGSTHKLTQLLRSVVKKNNKSNSKSKQKLEISEIGSIQSLTKRDNLFKSELPVVHNKEKELKRIYAAKRTSHSQVNHEKYLKNDLHYYLKSLEKLNDSKRRKPTEPHHKLETSLDISGKQTCKIRKLHTQSSNPNRYDDKADHQRIKDIILNGKVINKSHVYSSINRLQGEPEKQKSLKKIKIEPEMKAIVQTELPRIIDSKPKQDEACQLI